MSTKKNDFFNLNSDSSDSDVEVKKDGKKWDWDRPENHDLYFKNTKKHSLVNEDDSLAVGKEIKKICKFEKEEYENSKYKKLIGHTDCVNRIYWSKKNENLLLSSSMDRYVKKVYPSTD